MGGFVLIHQLLQLYLFVRKEMTKLYFNLFSSSLNITVLNCAVICRTNSGQTKIEHFKFRVELVQALLIEHGSERIRKFPGHNSTEKNVPRRVKRHLPLTRKKGQANKEVSILLQKQYKEGDGVFVPRM